ncbi:MAG: extensin family protein [Myxococcales bacterium]|nr:extensin family protein [Myxococcales bacterium]
MRRWLLALIAVALCAQSADARPHKKRKGKRHRWRTPTAQLYPAPSDPMATPAVRYGALTPDACMAELTARQIPFVAETADGVAMPVRLQGPLRGVAFHGGGPEADRATSPHEIADCRLVLALDDLAQLLAAHDVVEMIHYSMYRRPRAGKSSEHNAGMAIDVGRLRLADGTTLSVLDDYHGRIGAPSCGKRARPRRPTARTTALRAIVCEVAAQYLFNVVLTPNFNRPHRNHVHLDLTAGKRWFIVR